MKELKLEIEELEERIAPGRPSFVTDFLVELHGDLPPATDGNPPVTPGGQPFDPPRGGGHDGHGNPNL